uniref:bifunctional phosphopantothenoylcysteine decarboxylase/phosphopantothenate--cysteine ligase CoaBC n=1 Tax=Candidatus Planktophila sp. TaxID=2175601 RepID=UPI00404B4A87
MSAREVVLGIGGGIAAYKSCELLRRLQDAGFGVTVIPTPSSLHFVGKATWEALSGRTVTTTVWERVDEVRHVHLAKVSEFNIIAPATADLIARIAHGRADDLLTNTLLASKAPTLIVPAMHPAMWANKATRSNVSLLRDRGYVVMEPDHGRLTGSDIGVGRFPETSRIVATFKEMTDKANDLSGIKVLVTAGGTREMIDPIRFIGNNSSGRQGFAIAKAAMRRGAEVTLVLANSTLPDLPGITTVRVTSADQMYAEVHSRFALCDVIAMSAAVADARPAQYRDSKIKKGSLSSIELTANKDIIATVAKDKKNQVVIAFAAETTLDIEEGERKLLAKSADILFLNDVSGSEIFGSDETQGVILTSQVSQSIERVMVDRISKDTLADLLLDQALNKLG